MKSELERKDILPLVMALISIVTPAVIFLLEPKNLNPLNLFIFIGIGIFLLVIFSWSYVRGEWNNIVRRIENNNKEMQEIKKSLKTRSFFNDIEVRMRLLEEKSKRGDKK
jgi:hypothetical protein